jgi:hypothetical protein
VIPSRRTGWSLRARALAVALAAAAVYAGTLRHGFVYDDTPEIVNNEAIESLVNVPRLFAHGAWSGAGDANPIYRPLTAATYAIDHAIAGRSPWAFHLTNVVLHAVASALVVALATAVGLPATAAAIAGLAFAVLPVHVEAVANVAGRKDVLVAVFAMLALLAHRAALAGGRPRTSAWAAAAAPAAFLAALFSKESGMAVVGALAAHDLLLGREAWRARPRRGVALFAAYAGALAVYLVARHAAVGSVGVPSHLTPYQDNPLAHAAAGARIATAIAVAGRGVALLVAPVTLSPDYSFAAIPPAGLADPWFAPGALALAAGAAGVALAWRRAPWAAFAILWYAALLAPASNLLVAVGTVFGERLLYAASAGFCLLVGWGGAWLVQRAPAARWAGLALGLAFGARAAAYAEVWSDELTLFSHGVRVQPASSKMRGCLGAALMEQGRPEEAIAELEAQLRILRAAPVPPTRASVELGVAYEAAGRLADAASLYEQAAREDRGAADPPWRLGVVRWR